MLLRVLDEISLSKITMMVLPFVVGLTLHFEEDNLEGWPIESTSCPDITCSDHKLALADSCSRFLCSVSISS